MATTSRGAEDSLASRLIFEGHRFDFFQAVRLLMREQPEQSVGEDSKPQEEPVRFRTRLTLEFPASAIHEIQRRETGQAEMTVSFMGLTGTQGVLPLFYTEWMILRQSHKDSAMAAFLDLFNHRWISLFYRAWEKYRLPAVYELTQRGRGREEESLHRHLFDLAGIGTKGLSRRLSFDDRTAVLYAGLLSMRSKPAVALRGLLRDFFRVPVEILQFCGAWYRLAQPELCFLSGEGISNRLGDGAVLGDGVWDPQGLFEIRIGPLPYREFRSFLPAGRLAPQLADMVRLYCGGTHEFRVRLLLKRSEVPDPVLGLDDGPRLGWDLWLHEENRRSDPDEMVFAMAA